MGNYILSNRLDSNCALTVSLSPTNLTVTAQVVAIRDGDSAQAPLPLYLDFFDNTFKTVGWVTRQAALFALGSNFFALDGGLDVSAFTNLPFTTDQLFAEYELTVGGQTFTDNDLIQLARGGSQVHLGWTYDGTTLDMVGWMVRDGDVVLAPLSFAISWFNEDGTLLFTEPGPGVADAQGHILISRVQALASGQAYYAVITMTDAQGTLTTDQATPLDSTFQDDENICHLGVTFTGTTINMEGWLERDLVVVTPISMAISWYNQDGTLLFAEPGPGVVDAQDHVLISRVQALTGGQSYYARITITDAIGAVTTDRAIPFNTA